MRKTGIAKSKVKVRVFHKDRLEGEMLHHLLLSAFYGLETAKLFGWSVEHRYRHMTQAQVMLKAGHSRMYYGVVCGRGRNPTLRLWPTIFSGKIDVFPGDRRSRLISSMTSVAPA